MRALRISAVSCFALPLGQTKTKLRDNRGASFGRHAREPQREAPAVRQAPGHKIVVVLNLVVIVTVPPPPPRVPAAEAGQERIGRTVLGVRPLPHDKGVAVGEVEAAEGCAGHRDVAQ